MDWSVDKTTSAKEKPTRLQLVSCTLTSYFITFSWLTLSVFPLLRVIHVGHSQCDLLVQPPETGFVTRTLSERHIFLAAVWPFSRELLVSCPHGKPLQDFLVALRAEVVPVCTQVLCSLLGDVPEVFKTCFTLARLDLIFCVNVGCDSDAFRAGMTYGRQRNLWYKAVRQSPAKSDIWVLLVVDIPGAVKQSIIPSSPVFAAVTCESVEPRTTT